MKKKEPITATVFEIQRMSTEDGPGIRTTVFFKGCTLKCRWCHNPESIDPRPEVHWLGERCIGCGTCVDACPEKALSSQEQGIVIDRSLCTGCGACADQCPSTALELLGRLWTVADLLAEVMKDRAYFDKSGGGVTLSGGEAVMQAPFSLEFLKSLKASGVHTALDTSGQCSRGLLEMLLPYCDMVLYDIKEINSGRHRQFTGSGNETILENLRHIGRYCEDRILPREIWIRTPVIPGATASAETIMGIGQFLADSGIKKITRWELLCFNNLCGDKYSRLGREWAYRDEKLLGAGLMEELAQAARESGVNPGIVRWSGSTRLDQGDGDEDKADETQQGATRGC